MSTRKNTRFSTISELTAAEARKVNGGASRSTNLAFGSPSPVAAEEIEFKGATILANGGTYDHDEKICVMDE